MQGNGTNFYSAEEYYEGEWHADQRSGWGRMYYADGSVYEGEWLGDKRSGKGLLRLCEQLTTPYNAEYYIALTHIYCKFKHECMLFCMRLYCWGKLL